MRRLLTPLGCLLVCCMAAAIAAGRSCSEVLLQESFDSWTRVPTAGWGAQHTPGGKPPELVADGHGGKAIRSTAGSKEASYISYDLGMARRELYISLRIIIEAASQGTSWEEQNPNVMPVQLIGEGNGKTAWRAAIFADIRSRQLVVAMSTPDMGMHSAGVSWMMGEEMDIGIGLKYAADGHVRFYYGGARIYEANYDTTKGADISNVRYLRIGAHYGATATTTVDNVRVATMEGEASVLAGRGSEPPSIYIQADSSKVIRRTNMRCFGVNAGMIAGPAPYSKLKAATRAIGLTSVRWCPIGPYAPLDWDLDVDYPPLYPQPLFYKKRDPSSPVGGTGRSFEEHLSYFADDPQVVCIANMWGARGTDYQGKRLDGRDGWIQYNMSRGHKDCIYEIGNESDGSHYSLASYMFTGASWDRISCGYADWPPPGPERLAQSLMQSGGHLRNQGYDYTFPLNNKGSAIYMGFRYRWAVCHSQMATAAKGGAKLAWAIWTSKGWLTVRSGLDNASKVSYLLNQYSSGDERRDPRNLTASGLMFWSKAFYQPEGPFDRWSKSTITQITGGECHGNDDLYYVKVWLADGTYDVQPEESTVEFIMAPSEYSTVSRSFANIIRRNGGKAYAGATSVFGYPGWLEMLDGLSSALDGYAFHGYTSEQITWEIAQNLPRTYVPFASLLYSAESLRKTPAELRSRKSSSGKKLALTEWAAPEAGYIGGLYTAIGLCEVLKGGWDTANHYQWCTFHGTRNPYGMLCSFENTSSTGFYERPNGTAFRMVRKAAKSELVEAECRYVNAGGDKSYSGVYVCCFRGTEGGGHSLIVVNRTDIDFRGTPIRWKEAARKSFQVTELHSSGGLKADNETTIQIKDERRPSVRFSGSGEARIDLPPYSMFVLDSQG